MIKVSISDLVPMQIGRSESGNAHFRVSVFRTMLDGDLAFWIRWVEKRIVKGKGRKKRKAEKRWGRRGVEKGSPSAKVAG